MMQLPGKDALGKGPAYASSTPHLVLTLAGKWELPNDPALLFPGFGKKTSDLSCFLWGFGRFSTPYHAHLVFSVSWHLPCLSHSAEEHPLV